MDEQAAKTHQLAVLECEGAPVFIFRDWDEAEETIPGIQEETADPANGEYDLVNRTPAQLFCDMGDGVEAPEFTDEAQEIFDTWCNANSMKVKAL